jgi:hypothetical protein
MKALDLTGQRFGRLTALAPARKYRNRYWIWTCVCDCGHTTEVLLGDLKSGNTQSCGCFRREVACETGRKSSTTHGMTNTSEYWSYKHARRRCNNPSDANYGKYGSRGIKFLFASFEQFYGELGPLCHIDTDFICAKFTVSDGYVLGRPAWKTPEDQRKWLAATQAIEIEPGELNDETKARLCGYELMAGEK